MGLSLSLTQGTAADFQFQLPFSGITDPFAQDYEQTVQILGTPGAVATGVFLTTDTLAATVWAGDNETTLLTPSVTWISAANGQAQISFQNTDSAGLAIGQYYLASYGDPCRNARANHGPFAPGNLPGGPGCFREPQAAADVHQHHGRPQDRPVDRGFAGPRGPHGV